MSLSKLNYSNVIALLVGVVGIIAADGLITNNTEKIVTGAISGVGALGFFIYSSVKEHGAAKVAAAQIAADAAKSAAATHAS